MIKWKAGAENTVVVILFNIVVLVCEKCFLQKVSNGISLQVELLIKMWRLGCLRFHHSVLNMTVPFFFFFNISS